jgi:hypothetical protein
MCKEHSPLVFRQGGVLVREPGGSADDARPVSRELAGLGLVRMREAVYHCKDDAHIVRGGHLMWTVIGAGVAALGFLLVFASVSAGLVVLLIGALIAGVAQLVRWMAAQRMTRPPLPLVPQVNTVDLVERLTGHVRLEDNTYTSKVRSLSGEMTVDLSSNDGRAVLREYRKKFGVPGTEAVPFSAGYLMVQGDAGLAFLAGQTAVLSGGTGIALGGESADEHELFPVDPDRPQGQHTLVLDYQVQADRTPPEIPLWIVPSLVPGSDRRTLEIDLHCNPIGPKERRLGLAVFDLVELRVPPGWGTVESSEPGRMETEEPSGTHGARRVIRWRQVKPRPGEHSLPLKLRFKRSVTEIDEPAAPASGPHDDGADAPLTLSGTLEATFEGLLSGVDGVGVFLPGGGPGYAPPTRRQTKVAVTFEVSLRSIRYQDDRIVPDEHDARDVEDGRHRPVEFAGVVPDYRTVAALTDAISDDNFYVKSVVEHPPYGDDGRPGVLNRVWDIAGRRYVNLFPIDFDINLRGEEFAAGALAGKTIAQVTVKGAYTVGTLVDRRSPASPDTTGDLAGLSVEADDGGNDLLQRIEDAWTQLHKRVTGVLADRATGGGGARALGAAPDGVVLGEIIDMGGNGHAGDILTADVIDAEVVAAEVVTAPVPAQRAAEPVPPPPAAKPVPDLPDAAAAELRRRRQAADEAVIEGRINEDTHRGIIARIQAELDELEGRS